MIKSDQTAVNYQLVKINSQNTRKAIIKTTKAKASPSPPPKVPTHPQGPFATRSRQPSRQNLFGVNINPKLAAKFDNTSPKHSFNSSSKRNSAGMGSFEKNSSSTKLRSNLNQKRTLMVLHDFTEVNFCSRTSQMGTRQAATTVSST